MTRRVAGRVLLVLFGAVAPIVVAELALRAGEPSREWDGGGDAELARDGTLSLRNLVHGVPQRDVVFALRPNLQGTFLDVPLATNALGLRDAPLTLSKPPGELRVVALGDSVLFGWGVPEEETYAARLELSLTRRCARPVEIVNLGVPGYNTAQEVALLEARGLDFEPDAVLLQVVYNDQRLPHFLSEPRRWAPNDWILVERWLRTARGGRSDRLLPHNLSDLPAPQRQRAREAFRHLAGAEAFANALERLARVATERGIPAVLLVDGVVGEPWSEAVESAERHGFHLVNAGPTLRRALEDRGARADEAGLREHVWLSNRDRHPNALGHEIYARALEEPLSRLLCDAAAG